MRLGPEIQPPVPARIIAPPITFSDLLPRDLVITIINLTINNGETGNTGYPHRQMKAGLFLRREKPCQVLMLQG
jgi:hypothetical protein